MALDQSWLFFGGPYSNLQATRAILAEAARRAIPPQRILCTGDLVAYCGNPVETVDLIRDSGIAVVMGNCDEQLGASASDCGCGFEPGSACARLSADWYAYADSVMRADQREWLASLPERIEVEICGYRLAAIHGSADSINAFVFPGTPDPVKRASLEALGVDGVIAGHSGLPFTQVLDGRLWHNPGVVGMPANDGTPRVWFSVIAPNGDGLSITRHALAYDHLSAQDAMGSAGLPACYRDALASGLWPSLDVMTPHERAATGLRIEEDTAIWRPTQRKPFSNSLARAG